MQSNRVVLNCLAALSAFAVEARPDATAPVADESGRRANCIVVTPNGPEDGGDFGPKTPGTKTSGLQEALNAAKIQAKDVYLSGGSWTHDKTNPVVYVLNETLRVPWMQNFRLDSGHCVIHYAKPTGDAVVIDSQMSCRYRFGLIVSVSDGAAVRLAPTTEGPDRFRVITSTEFTFNALVGGGGAWPGGEAYNSTLDKRRKWVGTGLLLDATSGSIDGNKITVIETVGCERGIWLRGACTHNTIEATLVHLCSTHLEIGDDSDPRTNENRIEAHMDGQGIEPSIGARVYGKYNVLTLSAGQLSAKSDLIFEKPSLENLVFAQRLPHGFSNNADVATNRIVGTSPDLYRIDTPAFPKSGEAIENRNPFVVEVRITVPGKVHRWNEIQANSVHTEWDGPLIRGQCILLNPGDRVRFNYDEAPDWSWKGIR